MGFQRWPDIRGNGRGVAEGGSGRIPGSRDGHPDARDLRFANRAAGGGLDCRRGGCAGDDRGAGRDRPARNAGCGGGVACPAPGFGGPGPLNLPDFTATRPRAVALDLDETTLGSDSRLTDRTRSALHAVNDAGLPMVIATSRPERVLPVLVGADILEITSLVQMNGTIAIGRAGLSGSFTVPFDRDDARLCWEIANETTPRARMTME
ncbi:MAG: hypothetical protein E2O75_06390, partial [Chloroflexi bacterium]